MTPVDARPSLFLCGDPKEEYVYRCTYCEISYIVNVLRYVEERFRLMWTGSLSRNERSGTVLPGLWVLEGIQRGNVVDGYRVRWSLVSYSLFCRVPVLRGTTVVSSMCSCPPSQDLRVPSKVFPSWSEWTEMDSRNLDSVYFRILDLRSERGT